MTESNIIATIDVNTGQKKPASQYRDLLQNLLNKIDKQAKPDMLLEQ